MSSNFTNRTVASSDGATGLDTATNGNVVRNASDGRGRWWTRLFQGSAPVDALNPLSVDVITSALATGAATAVNQGTTNTVLGTVADAAVTTSLAGTLSAKLRGIIAIFSDSTLGGMIRGTIAHDAVDSGNPVKTGGYAVLATNIGSLTAVADADRVNNIASNVGETYVYNSRLNAGEDIINNQLATAPAINALVATLKFDRALATSTVATSLSVKGSPGNLFQFMATNLSGATAYLFLINKASAAGLGDAMYWPCYPVPAGGIVSGDWGTVGHSFTTGIQIAWSSTANTVTLVAGGPIGADFK